MDREIKLTEDGSKTLYISEMNESYHSHHGALQEAKHVFIKNGLNLINICEFNILELGFGTGLNLLVTIDEFIKNDKSHKIHYYTVEKYPVSPSEVKELNYPELFDLPEIAEIYYKAHEAAWNQTVEIYPNFFFTKFEADFFEIKNLDMPNIDLVYFDCFGARVQPDLWELPLFEILDNKINTNGLITTYSSKGSVRRILIDLNYDVEKRVGPPGKREMMIAWKKD